MSSGCSVSDFEPGRRLASLEVGEAGVVLRVLRDNPERAERLKALGVTPGARVRVLQRFPGFVFECDQTELAVEPLVARAILVE
jgi:Fe2+ transport system protein FeoA